MSRWRWLTAVGFVAALLGAGFGAYALVFHGEPPPAVPDFDDDRSKSLSPADQFDKLAREEPVTMLGQCLSRYTREVAGGIHCTFEMQERVEGKPKHPEMPGVEVIDLWVRGDVPDAKTRKTAIEVLMKWQSGAKRVGGAEIRGTLFSEKPEPEGLDGKVITWRPGADKVWMGSRLSGAVDPNNFLAKRQSRYCVRDAGLYRSMLRTYEAWKGYQAAGELKVEYLGKKTIPQIGRECHVVKRLCPRTEIDSFEVGGKASSDPQVIAVEGFTEVTVYIDAERWLQVGTELYRTEPDGTRVMVGTYYFRDVQPNPTFTPGTFTVDGLKR